MQQTLIPIKALLDQLPDIHLAYVFGSLADGTARADSDVDIAVLASSPLDAATRISLIDELTTITGRPVDLIDLHSVGEPLLGEILRHGIRLKGSDTLHAQLMTRHVFDNEDFMPYVVRMLSERRQTWTQ